jgi:uncharacterized membrane protein YphA (DoxX/SURF4 family)
MLLRRVARPLLAGIFIQGGISALRDPKTHADMAAPVVDRVTAVAPIEQPPDGVTLVRIDAGVKIGAGTLLALGKAPRFSAALLAASIIPTTAAQHRFWEESDPNKRANDQLHFTKNLALLGGLMLAAADTEGKPSLAWRARRAGRTSAATAELFHRDVTEGLGNLSVKTGELTGVLAEAAAKAGERAAEAASSAGEQASGAAARAGERLGPVATRAGELAGDRAARAGGWTGQFLVDAESAAAKAFDQARRSKTVKDARKAAKKARKRAEKRAKVARAKAEKRASAARANAEKQGKILRAKAEKRGKIARANADKVRANVEARLAA